jgi:hypothetical protein
MAVMTSSSHGSDDLIISWQRWRHHLMAEMASSSHGSDDLILSTARKQNSFACERLISWQ